MRLLIFAVLLTLLRNQGPAAFGGKRIQTMFSCFSCHARLASEGRCNNLKEKSQCLLQPPQAALRARAKRWLGAVFFPSCTLAYFQMFQAAAHGVLSGSVSLDLLSYSFSFLCFSPTGRRSFIDKKKQKTYIFLITFKIPRPVSFSEDPWKCFGQSITKGGRVRTAEHLIKCSFYQ